MRTLIAFLALVAVADAGRCWPKSSSLQGGKACIGKTIYIDYENAQRTCTVIAIVPKHSGNGFDNRWTYFRVGKPLKCWQQSNCWGDEQACNKVSSHLFSPAVKFYLDPSKFSAGRYEVRMYTFGSYPDARSDIQLYDCTTPQPTPMPTPVPPTPQPTVAPVCVEANPPQGTLTYTKVDTVERMEGWSDCSHNLKHIPNEWKQTGAFTCKGPNEVPKGTTFTLKCPSDSQHPCDWFITHYHCPPCSGANNGGWPGILATDGWETGSCGPYIATPFHHETATYRRQLAPGETVTVGPSVRTTKYMTFHMVPGADCTQQSAGACDANSFCSVVNGNCVFNWCPRRHIPKPGPTPCTKCLESCE